MDTNTMIFAFGILGNIISFLVILSPMPTFREIYKRKSTEGFQCIPYIVSLFSAMLWIYYAILKTNAILLLTINSAAILAHSIYISLFIYFATKKVRVTAVMLLLVDIGAMALIVLLTYFLQKDVARVTTVGWICLVFSLCVFVAPLTIIRKVVKTKSVEYMPFYLSLFLTISAVAWFFYGLLRKDNNIALPNIIGFSFGIMQMVLYFCYKNSKKVSAEIETEIEIGTEIESPKYSANVPLSDRALSEIEAIDFARLSPIVTVVSPGNTRASTPGHIEITVERV